MKFVHDIHYSLDIFNRACIAYIENVLGNKGIYLQYRKPTIPCYQGDLNLLPPESDPSEYLYGLDYVEIRTPIELDGKDFVLELGKLGIEDFMRNYFYEKGNKIAEEIYESINKHKYCDIKFSELPDCLPFPSSMVIDPETDFKARLMYGVDMMNKSHLILDINFLILERVREVTELVDGKEQVKWMPVSMMTEDQRLVWDKQPEMKEDKF